MPRKPLLGMSILFALAPIAFGVIRAVRTGDDFRYLWVTLAAFVAAVIAFVVVRRGDSRRPTDAAVRALAVFVVATAAAVIASSLLGVRVVPGSLVVTSAFGFCYAAGCGLYVLSRR